MVLEHVRLAVDSWLSQRFYSLGHTVGSRPVRTIVLVILATLLLGSGLVLLRWEDDINKTYVPRSAEGYINFAAMNGAFGPPPRLCDLVVTAHDGGDMLRKAHLLQAVAAHEAAAAVVAPGVNDLDSGAITLRDVCERQWLGDLGAPCMLYALNLTSAALSAMDQPAIDAYVAAARTGARAMVFGKPVVAGLDGSGGSADNATASALRFWYFTSASRSLDTRLFLSKPDPMQQRVTSWETAFLAHVAAVRRATASSGLVRVTGTAEKSITDEIARNVAGSSAFMGLSIVLIIIYMGVSIGGAPPRASRLALGQLSVCNIMFAEMSGFALSALCGVPLTDISLLLVFVVVGIGVDDVIILVDFLDREPEGVSAPERLGRAMQKGGATIFLTSFTNLVAFASAAAVDFPGLSWFCISGGFTVFFLFIYTCTFFAAALVIDERRRKAGALDGTCCCYCVEKAQLALPSGVNVPAPVTGSIIATDAPAAAAAAAVTGTTAVGAAVKQAPQEEDASVTARVRRWLVQGYAPIISQHWVAGSVLIVCFTVALVSGLNSRHLTIGLKFEDNFPDGSYLTHHFDRVERDFTQLVSEGALVFSPAPDLALPTVRAKVEAMTRAFEASPDVQPPLMTWLRVFAAWQQSTSSHALAAAGATFHTQVAAFLRAPPFMAVDSNTTYHPASYRSDVVLDAVTGAVTHSRFKMRVLAPTSLTARIRVVHALRRIFRERSEGWCEQGAGGRESPCNGFPYAYFFMYSDRDEIVHYLIKVTLIGAATAVVLVLLFFLQPFTVFGIACCVCTIDASLFGLMAVWDVPIDVSSFICLVIAVGLSVDYVVHLGHAFEHAPCGTATERVAAMLNDIGASVVKGGMSTFLGILVLAFTSSAVFRLFFKMLFGTVTFGMFAGLVLFPAIMSFGANSKLSTQSHGGSCSGGSSSSSSSGGGGGGGGAQQSKSTATTVVAVARQIV